MLFRYELRLGASSSTGVSHPMGLDAASSMIRIDAPTCVYLFIQAQDIFATAEIDGNLEIFTRDHSTLVIENYYGIAAGSRIYVQNGDDIHSHTEYEILGTVERASNATPATMARTDENIEENQESTGILRTSNQPPGQNENISQHDAEQAIYKELFRKDGFTSGQYDISYDFSNKTYIANDNSLNFLEIAKTSLEEASSALDDSNDMGPEIYSIMFAQAIDSMADDHAATMLFRSDGTRSDNHSYLKNTGEWSSTAVCNYLQVATHFTADQQYSTQPIPVYSAHEIFNFREKANAAVMKFEKSHGNAAELFFNFKIAAHDAENKNNFTERQKSFLSGIHSRKNIDTASTIKEINEIFSNTDVDSNFQGLELQASLHLLKTYVNLLEKEKSAKAAFIKVDESTKAQSIIVDILIKNHSQTVKEKELNEQHYNKLIHMCEVLDNIKDIETGGMAENEYENHPAIDDASGEPSRESIGQTVLNGGTHDLGDGADAALTGLMAATEINPY